MSFRLGLSLALPNLQAVGRERLRRIGGAALGVRDEPTPRLHRGEEGLEQRREAFRARKGAMDEAHDDFIIIVFLAAPAAVAAAATTAAATTTATGITDRARTRVEKGNDAAVAKSELARGDGARGAINGWGGGSKAGEK